MNEIPPHLMGALHRAEAAKQAILKYPHYTDEQRDAWFDSIDGWLDCQVQAYKNAKEALEQAFKNAGYTDRGGVPQAEKSA